LLFPVIKSKKDATTKIRTVEKFDAPDFISGDLEKNQPRNRLNCTSDKGEPYHLCIKKSPKTFPGTLFLATFAH
jgi:hypothetical protein